MLLCAGTHHQVGCEMQVVAQIGLEKTAWRTAGTQPLANFTLLYFAKSCRKHKAGRLLCVEFSHKVNVTVRSVGSKQTASQ